jgi:hypothetical protein
MDRINEYRQIVREFLEDFIKNDPNAQLIFDLKRDSPEGEASPTLSSRT